MKFIGPLTFFAYVLGVVATDTPSADIIAFCAEKGQVPSKADGKWKCVESRPICGPDEDVDTLHKNADTGIWECCPQGHTLKDSRCVAPEVPDPDPSVSCTDDLKKLVLSERLQGSLSQCCPDKAYAFEDLNRYFANIVGNGLNMIDLFCKDNCKPTPKPKPDEDWWRCPKDNSPCKSHSLEANKGEKFLWATGAGSANVPNPNIAVAGYKYPFDTWLTVTSGQSFELFIKGEKVQASKGSNYLIPAGTLASDVTYKASEPAKIQFYAACSKHTPCIGDQVKDWALDARTTQRARDVEIDVSSYEGDLIFTLADVSYATEQYDVFADGVHVGKTHGRLTLGEDMWNTAHINPSSIWAPNAAGALGCIANDGFWGSFRIPRGTKKVTVRLIHEQPGWPSYWFMYRIDKPCSC